MTSRSSEGTAPSLYESFNTARFDPSISVAFEQPVRTMSSVRATEKLGRVMPLSKDVVGFLVDALLKEDITCLLWRLL